MSKAYKEFKNRFVLDNYEVGVYVFLILLALTSLSLGLLGQDALIYLVTAATVFAIIVNLFNQSRFIKQKREEDRVREQLIQELVADVKRKQEENRRASELWLQNE